MEAMKSVQGSEALIAALLRRYQKCELDSQQAGFRTEGFVNCFYETLPTPSCESVCVGLPDEHCGVRYAGALPLVVFLAVFCSLVAFRHLALHAEFSALLGLWLVFRFFTALLPTRHIIPVLAMVLGRSPRRRGAPPRARRSSSCPARPRA